MVSVHEDVCGMALTSQAASTTTTPLTQPRLRAPEAEQAACLQLPTQRGGQPACQFSTGRKKRGQCTSAWLLHPNEESGEVAGAVATADFTSP